MNKRIAIIGGGITGLSAAYSLWEEKSKNNAPIQLKLFEASNRLGGKIHTVYKDDFIIERGADSFLARKKPAVELIKKLGLEDQLVRNATGQAYVLVKNKLHHIPKGSYRGIPTRMSPYLKSPMFSITGKLRGTLDLIRSGEKVKDDLSLGKLLRKRYGNEFVDHLIEPLLAGIYSGDIDQMSVQATLPELIDIANEYHSITKGLRKTLPQPERNRKREQGAFYSLKNGLNILIEKLENVLSNEIELETKVDHIEKKENHYHILLSNGTVYQADAICITTEHGAVQKMFPQYEFIQETLEQIPTTSTANVALAYHDDSFLADFKGTGFVVSRKSDTRITACTWTHKKWPTTTPKGKSLLRTYVGKPNDQEIIHKSDNEIIELVQEDLFKTMRVKTDPKFAVVTRWPNGRPQYTVNHVKRMNVFQTKLRMHLPNVYVAGSSYHGVGIPDCIEDGNNVAQNILDHLVE